MLLRTKLTFCYPVTFHIQCVCLYMKALKIHKLLFSRAFLSLCEHISCPEQLQSLRWNFLFVFTSNNVRRINSFCVHISHKVKNKFNQFSHKRNTLKWCARGIITDLIYTSRVLLGSVWHLQKMVKRAKCDFRLGSEIRNLIQVQLGKNILHCCFSTMPYITFKPATYHNAHFDRRELRNIKSISEGFEDFRRNLMPVSRM